MMNRLVTNCVIRHSIKILHNYLSCFVLFCFIVYLFFPSLFFPGKPSILYDTTNPDWAPSLNLGHNNSSNAASAVDRFERKMAQVLNVKKTAPSAASALVKLGTGEEECQQMETSCGPNEKEIQTGFNSMPCEISRLSSENSSMKGKCGILQWNDDLVERRW